jgi:RNA polymerase sigma factor (sigma-70 family)
MRRDAPTTNITLLGRLATDPSDPDAWSRFVFVYGPHLVDWCRGFGLQDADARDVAQDVLLRLSRRMAQFRYDPSKRFRGWLRTMVRDAWFEWAQRRPPRDEGAKEGDGSLDALLDESAGEELASLIEREHESELFAVAMSSVARRVQPRTFEAFRLLALEGMPGKEAADRLGMNLGSAYAARAKVQRLIREEVEKLEESGAC